MSTTNLVTRRLHANSLHFQYCPLVCEVGFSKLAYLLLTQALTFFFKSLGDVRAIGMRFATVGLPVNKNSINTIVLESFESNSMELSSKVRIGSSTHKLQNNLCRLQGSGIHSTRLVSDADSYFIDYSKGASLRFHVSLTTTIVQSYNMLLSTTTQGGKRGGV